MTSVEPPPATGTSRPHRRRGGARRGRGGTVGSTPNADSNTAPPNGSLAFRPASILPETTTDPVQPQITHPNRAYHGPGRRGGFARGGRGGRGGPQPLVNGQRVFGGQLTSASPAPASEGGSLAGDAPEFVPGQPVPSRARHAHPPRTQQPRLRRMSKSQAPDIATRIHEDITNGQYECTICTNEVLPNSKVWSCKSCWSVLHLSCVKRWSKNEVSTHQQRAENGELPPARQWRCPGCNLPKDELPNNYTCWCAKEIDPHSLPGLPPHSCGQTCSKPRAGACPHPCELICHAGPCPPCRLMGPAMSCFCGKEMSSRRCLDTNYDSGWSCGQVCGDLLPCGEHECQRGCHEGLCGSCEVLIESKCYCGRVEKSLACSDREDEMESQAGGKTWMGSFDCGAECRRPFDCGNPTHFCKKECHVQEAQPAHCPFSPDVVTHCPCGKTPLEVLLSEPRVDCSAPIPHCQEKCQKLLLCGHLCQQKCHAGECSPCLEKVEITCRCGRTTSNSVCHQGMEEQPSCSRVCRATLNCGRHECGERCCPGEKKASERQVAKRKNRGMAAEENVEPEHICLRVCGRPLKCGNHTCQSLCHKGPCSSCLEAVFEEISCACGRTVLQPPQPCGTSPPSCNYECTRRPTCGHQKVKHQCHEDTEPCPPCPYLVEKPCSCAKKILKNQPCWRNEVSCGLPCGKKLKCGIHFCQKTCHRPGSCEDATTPCMQPCGRKRTVCEHSCSDPCHAPYPCKEIIPCQAKTFITCACQHQKQAIRCLASKTSPGNAEKSLDCNDECLRLQRNAKLAAALNIDPSTHTDDHIPYSTTTLQYFTQNSKVAQTHEREFRVFATDPSEKRLRFKPMKAPERAFLHALAEDFGLDSESQDPEPHRHVVVFKTPRFVSAPMKTLSQCAKIRTATAAVVEEKSAKPLVGNAEPWNGFLLTNPKFGLTIDELRDDLRDVFEKEDSGLVFDIAFLPIGDVVVHASSSGSWTVKVEQVLSGMKSAVAKKVLGLKIAGKVTLCAVDGSGNVLRREEDGVGEGWSQVAKGGGRKVVSEERGVGGKSAFTVLGRVKEKKVERREEDAVEDWEKEVEAWGDS